MNENLNLCEILKDCPIGTKLWTPFLGEVALIRVDSNLIWVKGIDIPYTLSFSINKKDEVESDELLLFPSKEQRDWSKFKVPVKRFNPKEFKPFDKVLLRSESLLTWIPSFFGSLSKQSDGRYWIVELGSRYSWGMGIPYNDETKQLAGTTDDCPDYYKWWEK